MSFLQAKTNFKSEKYITDKDIILKIGVILVSLGIIYYPNIMWLIHVWGKDPNFSFGFLIPFITTYLIYRNRDRITETAVDDKKRYLGGSLILFGALLYLISTALKINTVSTYSMIVLMLGISFYFLGGGITRYFVFPFSYLILMVPVTYVLLNPLSIKLKYLASYMSAEIIRLINVPVLREGVVIRLSNSTLEVVDACSGMRSLLALLAIGVVFVYLNEGRLTGKLALMITIGPIAIIVNIVRILTLCFISEKYGIDLTSNELVHNASGVAVFLLGMVMLFLASKVIFRSERGGDGSVRA